MDGFVARVADRSGMIVLAPLITFACLLVIMVVGGKLIYPAPREPYRPEARPQRQYAAAAATVYAGGSPVRRIEMGEALWMTRLDNGTAAVFADSTGRVLVATATALPTYPGPLRESVPQARASAPGTLPAGSRTADRVKRRASMRPGRQSLPSGQSNQEETA